MSEHAKLRARPLAEAYICRSRQRVIIGGQISKRGRQVFTGWVCAP